MSAVQSLLKTIYGGENASSMFVKQHNVSCCTCTWELHRATLCFLSLVTSLLPFFVCFPPFEASKMSQACCLNEAEVCVWAVLNWVPKSQFWKSKSDYALEANQDIIVKNHLGKRDGHWQKYYMSEGLKVFDIKSASKKQKYQKMSLGKDIYLRNILIYFYSQMFILLTLIDLIYSVI